jgi:hypothetical protein
MLYSNTRLGSLFQDLNASTFRKGALALTAAAAMFAGTSALSVFPASAQEVLSDAQCTSVKGATIVTLRDFRGKISAEFAESLGEFSKTCDLKTKFNRVPGVDDNAWDAFRVRMHMIRSSQASTPAALAQK